MPTTQIVVIGGGYAVVPAANRVLQRADVDVTLINPRPEFVERIRLHQLVAGNDDAVADYATVLSPRVRLIVDSADTIDADARKILLASGSSLAYDHLVYAVGSTAAVPASVPGATEFAYPLGELEGARALAIRMPDLVPSAPIVVVGGRLVTDETLTSVSHSSIVAAGDAAAPSALPLRMSCQLAMPPAAQAADTVLAHIEGRQPRVLNPASVGQCISLGRHAGTIQLSRFDDTAIGLHIGGRLAATIKESVCAGTLNFLAKEARKPGSYFWPRGGKRAEQLADRPVHP
ncbi:FAD-dependent oxidoreductase [Mycolicibacterium sp. A43C]